MKKVKKIFKYPTGAKVPEGAEYLCTIKNGLMPDGQYYFVWHYFLVEVVE